MKKYHVKKGDKVIVNTGKWSGKEATISAVLTKSDRVVLEFADANAQMREQFGKRTVKKSSKNPEGGLVERSVSVHVSNVNKVAAESK